MKHRRAFLSTVAATATGLSLQAHAASASLQEKKTKADTQSADAKPPVEQLPSDKVRAFVGSSHGRIESVKSLLSELPQLLNAAWDWKDGDWETGLGAASHVGNRDIASLLLDKGARIDTFAITMLGHTDVLKSILQHFPDTHTVPGPHGIPLISHAVAGRKQADDALQLLLNAGADVNASSNLGMTPLMMAASVGRVEVVEILLQHGAAADAKDSQGQTASDLAAKREHQQVVDLLKKQT